MPPGLVASVGYLVSVAEDETAMGDAARTRPGSDAIGARLPEIWPTRRHRRIPRF